MDAEQLCAVVDAIPPGRWMSYADVCAAAGGDARQAIAINQRLTRLAPKGAHRGRADGAARSRWRRAPRRPGRRSA